MKQYSMDDGAHNRVQQDSVRLNRDLVTITDSVTGRYLAVSRMGALISATGQADAMPTNLSMGWGSRNRASVLTRETAARVIAAYVALTGDNGIDIEPVTAATQEDDDGTKGGGQ